MKASLELANTERPDTVTGRKKVIAETVKEVARSLGNTPAIARASYIDPYLFEQFEKSDTITKHFDKIKKLRKVPYLSKDEQCVVKLLSNK